MNRWHRDRLVLIDLHVGPTDQSLPKYEQTLTHLGNGVYEKRKKNSSPRLHIPQTPSCRGCAKSALLARLVVRSRILRSSSAELSEDSGMWFTQASSGDGRAAIGRRPSSTSTDRGVVVFEDCHVGTTQAARGVASEDEWRHLPCTMTCGGQPRDKSETSFVLPWQFRLKIHRPL